MPTQDAPHRGARSSSRVVEDGKQEALKRHSSMDPSYRVGISYGELSNGTESAGEVPHMLGWTPLDDTAKGLKAVLPELLMAAFDSGFGQLVRR